MAEYNNQMQGTRQRHLPFLVTGRLATLMKGKRRLIGAPDLCPLCGFLHVRL